MSYKIKVCHITSTHKLNDVRINLKECTSLAKKYDVYLLGNDITYGDVSGDVKVINIKKQIKGRLDRFLNLKKDLLKEALKINADIYHVHDPDLLQICLALKKYKKTIIFDSHEDVPKQILAKNYIPKYLRVPISFAYARYEKFITQKIDAVVAATPSIRDKFLKYNLNTIDVNNYPLLNEFAESKATNFENRKKQITYVGGLSKERGIETIITLSQKLPQYNFKIAGNFSSKEEEIKYKSMVHNENIEFLGHLNRKEIVSLLIESMFGLVLLEKNERYAESLPIKMFEYMAAGLPFIATDFTLWKTITDNAQTGFCVNPNNLEEIQNILMKNIENPDVINTQSQKGINYVFNNCNWENEEQKLLNLYKKLEEI
ncbi:glycosyltransferase [Macrococcus armenti]|uniref:glycosyltransferase n=1 Tax=Macrococcus armenti TaxID=2875764 RepID=UPI001CCF0E08|nr:glycosyltransferase [Macrococcus armenti]UBH23099.1 glycosyltransferase [Macrococcus armenti]